MLHRRTKFDAFLFDRYDTLSVSTVISLVTLTFYLLTLKLVRMIARGVGNHTVACWSGTLNCGCPARVPGTATVISFIEQGVVSVGRAGIIFNDSSERRK